MYNNMSLLGEFEMRSQQKSLCWVQLVLSPRLSVYKASNLSLDHQVLIGMLQLSAEAKMHKLFLNLFHSE